MGCDEHAFLERYDRACGEWKPVREKRRNPWWDEGDDPDYEFSIPQEEFLTGGRDYTAYGILAGVRWECPDPLAQDRGLPDDLSEGLREQVGDDDDLHSHTWFTARELQNYRWGNTLQCDLYMTLHAYARWSTFDHEPRDDGMSPPHEAAYRHCADEPPPEFAPWKRLLTPEQAKQILAAFKQEPLPEGADPREQSPYWQWFHAKRGSPDGSYVHWASEPPENVTPKALRGLFVKVPWSLTYAELAGHLYQVGLPRLLEIAARCEVAPDYLRVVIAFDN